MGRGRLAALSVAILVSGCRQETDFVWGGTPTPTATPTPGLDSPIRSVSVSVTTGGLSFNWDAVPGASGYDVYVSQSPDVSPANHTITQPSVGSSETVFGLSSDGPWFGVVVATSAGNALPASAAVSAVPLDKSRLGLATTPAWTRSIGQSDSRYGNPIVAAGDVDDDGYDDVLVGAYSFSGGQALEGAVFLYSGSPTGLVVPPLWSNECDQAGAHCGTGVAVGDFDGDGRQDVVVGASDYDNPENSEGGAAMFRGTATSVATTFVWSTEPNQAGANAGRHLLNAGDVNGDGLDDLLYPIHGIDNGETDEGVVILHYGTASGLTIGPRWQAESNAGSARLGWGLAAGDFNGDGFSDVAAGAPELDGNFQNEGRAYAWYGSASGPPAVADWSNDSDQDGARFGDALAAGDFDGDTYSDLAVGVRLWDTQDEVDAGRVEIYYGSATGLSAAPDLVIDGESAGEFFGSGVGRAGDVNRDGCDDLLVGSFGFDGGKGRAYLFAGSPSGLSPQEVWTYTGTDEGTYLGGTVAHVGDVNADGRDDVMIGIGERAEIATTINGVWLFFGPASEGPVLEVGAAPTIAAGSSLAPPAKIFTDASPQPGHSCVIDWGDGSIPESLGACDPGILAGTTHGYPAAGRYIVRVRVTNEYGASSEGMTVLAVE